MASQARLFDQLFDPTVQELLREREITYRNLLTAYLKMQELARQNRELLASAGKPPSQSVHRTVFVPASAFARFYGNKSRQLIHLWAKNGVLKNVGFTIERDLTGHLSIGIP